MLKSFQTKKFVIVFALTSLVCLVAIHGETSMATDSEEPQRTATTITESTDEVGEPVFTIKSRSDSGFEIRPSVQITTTKEEFFCESHKVETILKVRREEDTVRDATIEFFLNGEEVDIRSVSGRRTNIIKHSNVDVRFFCTDDTLRTLISDRNALTQVKYDVLDFRVDTKTGVLTSHMTESKEVPS